jgi:heme-degrading monooxygenase HmoA
MIAIIFEVQPADGRMDAYLDYAARLKPELEQMDGFISVERRRSTTGATMPNTGRPRRRAGPNCSPITACAWSA